MCLKSTKTPAGYITFYVILGNLNMMKSEEKTSKYIQLHRCNSDEIGTSIKLILYFVLKNKVQYNYITAQVKVRHA